MTETLVREIAPGVFREGSEIVFDPLKVVVEGTKRAVHLIGETAQNRNTKFNETLIKHLHSTVMYYMPGIAGQYRGFEVVTIGGHRVANAKHIPDKMYLFGRWLEEETEALKDRQEDLLGGLRISCEAHYGLVSPSLHPFDDGNGRVARLLSNGILMLNAHELVFYGIKLLPIPLVRQQVPGKEDPYFDILEQINQTKIINPLEVYMAGLWSKYLKTMIGSFCERFRNKGKINPADQRLMEKFQNRTQILDKFIEEQISGAGSVEPHIVPDYFALKHVKI